MRELGQDQYLQRRYVGLITLIFLHSQQIEVGTFRQIYSLSNTMLLEPQVE